MHIVELAISKTGRNSKSSNTVNQPRSRSPDSYVPARPGNRQDEYGRDLPSGNNYRRSVSPRNNFRRRDAYDFQGSRNSRGDSYTPRNRERSRSPYGYRENRQYRERSPSPRQPYVVPQPQYAAPHRDPSTIPDVQIVLMEQLDGDFISWVVRELSSRGLKSEVMFLGPHEPLESIVQRQMVDGVHGICLLTMRSQSMSKIPLQVFKRRPGSTEIQFDEYQDLEPKIAADIVSSVKVESQQQVFPPPQQQFAPQPQYAPQISYQQPVLPPAAASTDLANAIGQMDNAALQKLLSMSSAPNTTSTNTNSSSIDLAAILGQLVQPQAPHQPPAPLPLAQQYQQPSLQTQEAGQVQNILAQLARFRQP
jgi:nuclear polyadenylated RNA-binding protein 3